MWGELLVRRWNRKIITKYISFQFDMPIANVDVRATRWEMIYVGRTFSSQSD